MCFASIVTICSMQCSCALFTIHGILRGNAQGVFVSKLSMKYLIISDALRLFGHGFHLIFKSKMKKVIIHCLFYTLYLSAEYLMLYFHQFLSDQEYQNILDLEHVFEILSV